MRIAIIKTSALGDVIQSFPAISYLRQKYPDATIDWIVEKSLVDLLSSHPDLNNIIPVETKRWRKNIFSMSIWKEVRLWKRDLEPYDLLFDLQGNCKSGFLTLLVKAKKKIGFSYSCVPEKPNCVATTDRYSISFQQNARLRYLNLIAAHFGEILSELPQTTVPLTCSESEHRRIEQINNKFKYRRPLFMICFGSRWPNKQLSLWQWKKLLQLIEQELSAHFLLIYQSDEEKRFAHKLTEYLPNRCSSVGELTLPLWQGLMHKCDGVISVDSASLHLCGTTVTPSFGVFGSSSSHCYRPLGKEHAAFQGKCPYNKQFAFRCPILRTCETGACIKEIDPEVLFNAFMQHYKQTLANVMTKSHTE